MTDLFEHDQGRSEAENSWWARLGLLRTDLCPGCPNRPFGTRALSKLVLPPFKIPTCIGRFLAEVDEDIIVQPVSGDTILQPDVSVSIYGCGDGLSPEDVPVTIHRIRGVEV